MVAWAVAGERQRALLPQLFHRGVLSGDLSGDEALGYGIVVRMYFFDDKQHHTPHVHAECSEDKAVLAILTGEPLVGKLPSGKMRLVQAWIEIHRDELMADWRLAVNGEEVFKIDPLN